MCASKYTYVERPANRRDPAGGGAMVRGGEAEYSASADDQIRRVSSHSDHGTNDPIEPNV